MTKGYLVLLSSAIIILITSFFVFYYINNIHIEAITPPPLQELDANTRKEMEQSLTEDYHLLESEVISYNNTNDYIKQERQLISLIEATIAHESDFREKEMQLKAQEIQETFDQSDIEEIQSIISSTLT